MLMGRLAEQESYMKYEACSYISNSRIKQKYTCMWASVFEFEPSDEPVINTLLYFLVD